MLFEVELLRGKDCFDFIVNLFFLVVLDPAIQLLYCLECVS